MKNFMIFAVLAFVALPMAASETAKVKVHVDGERLEDLLTDAQKENVSNLKITGRLAGEDYVYLRSELFIQLDTLDLLDADIDTIPSNVFKWEAPAGVWGINFRVILPKKLKHLADHALQTKDADIVFELTGPYPTLGKYVYGLMSRMEPSPDNTAYVLAPDRCIYSADGTTLYYVYFNGGHVTLPDGVRIIYSNAFEKYTTAGKLVLPASVDSIGDRAFADLKMHVLLGNFPPPAFVCEAVSPPKLGKDVFLGYENSAYDEPRVYVPDESVELYRKADGWKDLVILDISSCMESVRASSGAEVDIERSGEAYVVRAGKAISYAVCYNAGGQAIKRMSVCSDSFELARHGLPMPYMLVRICFADGTDQVVKLKP